MRAVETNVLLRLLTRDDEAQVRSAEAFIETGAWVSHLVMAETTWVLGAVYGLTHPAIATAVEMLLKHKSLTLQEADVVSAALTHYRRKPTLGFSDCLVLEIARKAGHLPLGTFDKSLGALEHAKRL